MLAALALALSVAAQQAPFVFSGSGASAASLGTSYLRVDWTNVSQVPVAVGFYEGTFVGFPALIGISDAVDDYIVLRSTFFDLASRGAVATDIASFSNAGIYLFGGNGQISLACSGAGCATRFSFVAANTAAGSSAAFDIATLTLARDTNFSLTGGINGLSFDGTTFSVDATNNRIGVGTAAPGTDLDVNRTANAAVRIDVINGSNGGAATSMYRAQNDLGNALDIGIRGSGFTPGLGLNPGDAFIAGNVADLKLIQFNTAKSFFMMGDFGGTNYKFFTVHGSAAGADVIVNEDQQDRDFQVRSDTDANVAFIDGANDCAAFGTATCSAGQTVFARHLRSSKTGISSATTGTCTLESIAGDDTRGKVNATCGAGDTIIIVFVTAYTTAPHCLISPADADAVGAGAYVSSSSTADFRITSSLGTSAADAGWTYFCME